MSGPATVPLAVAALFVQTQTLRLLFAILAFACGLFSSYWLWRKAQIEVNELKKRPYDEAHRKFVMALLAPLGMNHRDLLRYLMHCGQQTIGTIHIDAVRGASEERTREEEEAEEEEASSPSHADNWWRMYHRLQQKHTEAGSVDEDFDDIFDETIQSKLVEANLYEKAPGHHGLVYSVAPIFLDVLRDELFPRKEKSPPQYFIGLIAG
jgi:hypothetical protein